MIIESPSNLALIKYMGKQNAQKNIPYHASLSYTLKDFVSGVVLQKQSHTSFDEWKPLRAPHYELISMTEKEQERYILFFKKLKKHFNLKGYYLIQSSNNFSKSLGLASSASSFSALTLATYKKALEDSKNNHLRGCSTADLAFISREGSGSSCRSFFAPWCLWKPDLIHSLKLPELDHDVIYLDFKEKHISSSEAHLRVLTSPHWEGRVKRAEMRLQKLLTAFKEENWREVYLISKEEFEDMHLLFETASKPFSYRTRRTYQVLEEIEKIWIHKKMGPIVTMDAGSVIHLLYYKRAAHLKEYVKEKVEKLS